MGAEKILPPERGTIPLLTCQRDSGVGHAAPICYLRLSEVSHVCVGQSRVVSATMRYTRWGRFNINGG